jgi:ribosome biogenesis SPOUT family RNA methylase Rps3
MSQIKQISKIVNNTSKEKKYINLPRHVIGILCNHDPNSGTREMAKLNIPYFNDEKITFLKYAINVIKKNSINVVICVIKEKINGYPLGIEDYEIEDEKLKYRVELPYMYKKIAGKDIDPEKFRELKNR